MNLVRLRCVLGAALLASSCGSSSHSRSDAAAAADAAGSTGGTGVSDGAAGSGGSCSFTACGGDIVGTWHVTSACGSLSPASCPPPQSIVIEHETSQGTYTFASDGTVTIAISGTFSETLRYPFACLDGGTAQACADFQNMAQAAIAKADAGSLESYTCSADVDQACTCTETLTYPSPQSQTNSYVVSGDHVTIGAPLDGGVGDAGAPASVGYCVSGNTLTLQLIGDGNVAGDFVLTLSR
jgi:hypothetical protein